ncbi:restriction endonuclease subunit S [Desulfurispirillum indicum]|uniref:restriction endonuclease subunit S n=1 Tax=Desulfurispirillum indicum TaxID=936456 RepID=UPI001CFC3D4E|nr:restriction endonuclease subunit S [Desulfurispirillum indicum]UCZ57667.1 restriction endonuclease subunit S [Desulfurispirillum indicum]
MSKSTKTVIPTKAGIQKAKGLVPRLRFPEFRDSGQWRETQLGELGEFTGGGTPSKSNDSFWKGSIPWVSSSDISEDSIHEIRISRFITEEALKSSATKLVPKGSVLLVSRVGVGKLAITKSAVCTSQDFTSLTPCNDKLEFLGYLLKANAHALEGLGQGMAIKGFTKEDITKLTVYLPELEEQQKIADCLSSLDALIAAQADKIDALKNHKKGLMQQLFPREGETVPRLRFPEFRGAGAWDIRPLGKVTKNLDSKRIPVTGSARVKGDVPYYGATGIIDYVQDYIFDEDLLCISEDGANLIARNYPIAFSISGKTWVNNHAHVLRFKSMSTQVMVENYLNSISLKDFLTGMAQPKLNRAKLDMIPIPLPGIEEQQKIADCLSFLDALIAAHSEKHEALKTHKNGLMQQLFPIFEGVAE